MNSTYLANYITALGPPEHDQEATILILLHNKKFFCFEVLHKKTIAPIIHLSNRAIKTTTKWGWEIPSTNALKRGCNKKEQVRVFAVYGLRESHFLRSMSPRKDCLHLVSELMPRQENKYPSPWKRLADSFTTEPVKGFSQFGVQHKCCWTQQQEISDIKSSDSSCWTSAEGEFTAVSFHQFDLRIQIFLICSSFPYSMK